MLTPLFTLFAVGAFAQDDYPQDGHPQHEEATNIELSEALGGGGLGDSTIRDSIGEAGAAWLQLNFDEVELGENSTLTITHRADGATQTFDAESIEGYGYGSAYFNRRVYKDLRAISRNRRETNHQD